MFRRMPDLQLRPDDYRKPGAPRIISRRAAYFMMGYAIAGTLFFQWLITSAMPGQWWNGFLMWPGLIMVGVMATRLWPRFMLVEDSPNSADRPEQ